VWRECRKRNINATIEVEAHGSSSIRRVGLHVEADLNSFKLLAEVMVRRWTSGESIILICIGSGVAWRRRCLGGTLTGGPAVTVYSPPMTRNQPELTGRYQEFEIVNPVVGQ